MNYHRVIPRDLFNESMLLKCLGSLSLAILDGAEGTSRLSFKHNDEKRGFIIGMDHSDGSIRCGNLILNFMDKFPIDLFHTMNNRQPWPLKFEWLGDTGDVFNENGSLSEEFINLFKRYENE